MKKLTELVHLREKLTQAYDPVPAANELLHLNEKITSIVEERAIGNHQDLLSNLIADLTQVENKLQNNVTSFDLLIDAINKDNIDMMLDIRDFIQAHYLLCNRTDTQFWKDVKEKAYVPETLMQKLNSGEAIPEEKLKEIKTFELS